MMRTLLSLLAPMLLLLPAPGARAATPILIWPVDPVVTAERGATALWLENRGPTLAVMQVRVLRWSQVDGEERYQEQDAVQPSPPIVQIPAQGKQMIRLTAPVAGRAAGESAYRIIIDEVPVPAEAAAAATGAAGAAVPDSGIRIRMRYSIPLFVHGAAVEGPRMPVLRCSITGPAGNRQVTIANSGTLHARLVDVAFSAKGKLRPVSEGLMGYALPGSAISRPLPGGLIGGEVLTMAGEGGRRISIPGCADRE